MCVSDCIYIDSEGGTPPPAEACAGRSSPNRCQARPTHYWDLFTGPNKEVTGEVKPFQWFLPRSLTGVPRPLKSAPLQDPTVGLCLGSYGGPRGEGGSCERGIPVHLAAEAQRALGAKP